MCGLSFVESHFEILKNDDSFSPATTDAARNSLQHLFENFRSLADFETQTPRYSEDSLWKDPALSDFKAMRCLFWGRVLCIACEASRCLAYLWALACNMWACRIPNEESEVQPTDVSLQQERLVCGLFLALCAGTQFVRVISNQVSRFVLNLRSCRNVIVSFTVFVFSYLSCCYL